ncbi:unnamed protein product [Urochloa humidicola]
MTMMDALTKNHGFQHFKLQGSDYGGGILVLGEQGARLSLHSTHSTTTGRDTPRLEDGRGSILFHNQKVKKSGNNVERGVPSWATCEAVASWRTT